MLQFPCTACVTTSHLLPCVSVMALARRARRRRHPYNLPTSPQRPPAVAADHQVKLYIDNGNGVRGKGHAARYTQVRQVRMTGHATPRTVPGRTLVGPQSTGAVAALGTSLAGRL